MSLGYSDEEVNEMCFGIAIHVDDKADFEGERTPLALTIGDADNIDRYDALRLYETLLNDDFVNLSIEDEIAIAKKRIDGFTKARDYQYATKTGQALWQDRVDFQISYYKRLKDQLEKSFDI